MKQEEVDAIVAYLHQTDARRGWSLATDIRHDIKDRIDTFFIANKAEIIKAIAEEVAKSTKAIGVEAR